MPMLCIRYLLFVPHWFTNVSAALIGVPLFTFTWTTMVSCIPGTVLYTCAGAGLADFFTEQEQAMKRGEAVVQPTPLQVILKVVWTENPRDQAVLVGFVSLFILMPFL